MKKISKRTKSTQAQEKRELEKTKRNKELLLKNLLETEYLIYKSCELSGLSRQTYTRWQEEDPDFKEKCLQVEQQALENKRKRVEETKETIRKTALEKLQQCIESIDPKKPKLSDATYIIYANKALNDITEVNKNEHDFKNNDKLNNFLETMKPD